MLAKQINQALAPTTFDQVMQQATMLYRSGMLPKSISSVEQVYAIITLGAEMGIGGWLALNTINVIQGKPTISPQLMLALINNSGQVEDFAIDTTDDRAIVTMQRKGRSPHTEIFTVDDARALGLLSKDNYTKQRKTMLKWRAIAACARIVYPDIILGLYTPDEMGANVVIDSAGNMEIMDDTTDAAIRFLSEKEAKAMLVDQLVQEGYYPSAADVVEAAKTLPERYRKEIHAQYRTWLIERLTATMQDESVVDGEMVE